jgi:uncharacterized protein GlcG (DUF336 family)
MNKKLLAAMAIMMGSTSAMAGVCDLLPSQPALKAALTAAQQQSNGGFGLNMWATVVSRDGTVCAVAYTGADAGSQWPGSRVISAQKANTANAFSLPTLALSTANLYSAVQPGGTLFGLQFSNPVDTSVAYRGNSALYGTATDPMVGGKIGGVNVFGGGLALYNASHTLVGAVGVSGDSSCADHNIAWRVRNNLGLDHFGNVVGGVSGQPHQPDNIVYDIAAADLKTTVNSVNNSVSGWGHPSCSASATSISLTLPAVEN